MLEEAGVAAIPGAAFGPAGADYVRFSFASSTAVLKEAVRADSAGFVGLARNAGGSSRSVAHGMSLRTVSSALPNRQSFRLRRAKCPRDSRRDAGATVETLALRFQAQETA